MGWFARKRAEWAAAAAEAERERLRAEAAKLEQRIAAARATYAGLYQWDDKALLVEALLLSREANLQITRLAERVRTLENSLSSLERQVGQVEASVRSLEMSRY